MKLKKELTHIKDCFVQVNVSEEESKHGLQSSEVEAFIQELEKYNTYSCNWINDNGTKYRR